MQVRKWLPLCCVAATLSCFAAVSAKAEDFMAQVYSYEEYLLKYPDQAAKQAAFDQSVQKASPPVLTASVNQPVRISVIFPGQQVSDYWRRTVQAMEARLQQAKVPYKVNALFTKSATELRKQELFIHEELQKTPDYMVFTLDALRHKAVIENIMAAKTVKLFLQNITTPIREWRATQPYLYSGFDHELGSKLLAQKYIDLTHGEGNYAVFYGPHGYVSQMRGDTFVREIQDKSNLKLVASYYVGFNREKARKAALKLLSSQNDLAFIYACSTDIALGVVDALKETNRSGQVMVNGWGGGSAELSALSNGQLDFTVMRMNDDNGVAIADAIVMDLNGQSEQVPTTYSGDIKLLTKSDKAEEIEKLKQRAFRYSME